MSATVPMFCEAPSRVSTVLELRAPLELLKFPQNIRNLSKAPRGDGRPVMLLPGYLAGEQWMTPLQQYLSFIGYEVDAWGLGVNRGDVEGDIARFGERVAEAFEANGERPITLVGWSLGGIIARETARLEPDRVREVITLGTPIIGGPKYTALGAIYAASRGIDLDAFEKEVHARNAQGLTQPVTSIYSKNDGIVGWRASLDVYNSQANNIQVGGSHFALGFNPTVWRTIADVMAMSKDAA
ncbi:MAG: alpha/beta hydrolase [Pseudomonadota bacterium]